MQLDNAAVLRLKAIMEADPGALVRVLEHFQRRNIVPRRVVSERMGESYVQIYIEVDPVELVNESFSLVVAKINELPVVLLAVQC